jgi:hypothetical protein
VVVDWGRLQIEALDDAAQAKAGYRTLLVSGFFDVIPADPSAFCVAIDPEA